MIAGLMVANHPDEVMNALFEKSLAEYADQAEARACAALAAEGWTYWVGTHPAARDYCPNHKPDPRSTMRQIAKESA